MARVQYPSVSQKGAIVTSNSGTDTIVVYTTPACTVKADISLTSGGAAITGSVLTVTSTGVPAFWGPTTDPGVLYGRNASSGSSDHVVQFTPLAAVTNGRPVITGSKGANAALTSLLTSLAALGLVTDSTT